MSMSYTKHLSSHALFNNFGIKMIKMSNRGPLKMDFLKNVQKCAAETFTITLNMSREQHIKRRAWESMGILIFGNFCKHR